MKTIFRRRAPRAAASVSIAALLALAPGALAEDLTIADLAPRNSVLVVGVDDFGAMQASFDKTGLRDIWDEPSVQRWFEQSTREMTQQLTDMLQSIDAKREDLSMPTGAAGFALWMVEPEEPTDPPVAFIAMGDFGENAGKMHDTLMAALEEGEDKERLRLDFDEFADTTIYTIEALETENPDGDADPEAEEWEEWEDWEQPQSPQIEKVFYARVGSRLLTASALPDLENAIDRIAGDALDSIREADRFHASRAQIGAHHLYAVLLTNPIFTALDEGARKAEQETGMPAPQLMPWLDAFGISDVHAASMGVRFDADDGMMVSNYGVLAEEMRGILSLMDVQPAAFEPPAFVSADAVSYSMMQFELAQLVPTLQKIAQALPAQDAQSMSMGLGFITGFIGPVLDQLGPEIHWAQSYARPFSVDSQKTLVAIGAKDTDALAQAMAMSGANLGMTSRDFQGSQIWSMEGGGGGMGAMLPGAADIAIGVGAGHMFFGPTDGVENALRQAGAPQVAPSLAGDKRFQRALRVAGTKGFSFSYMNLPKTLDYMKWYLDNFDKIMQAQMEEMLGDVDDPELRAMMEENQMEKPEWMENLPDLSIIARHMGDSVTEFHRTEDGMRGRTIWLRPE